MIPRRSVQITWNYLPRGYFPSLSFSSLLPRSPASSTAIFHSINVVISAKPPLPPISVDSRGRFLRRIGFKALEAHPTHQKLGYVCGYWLVKTFTKEKSMKYPMLQSAKLTFTRRLKSTAQKQRLLTCLIDPF